MGNLKFGKLAKKQDDRTLRFATYTKQLAPPPVAVSNLNRVYSNLKINDPTKLFPMDGNDTKGDCTIAGRSHQITMYNGLIGKKKIPTKCATLRLYNKLTGGQDTGLNMLDVLKYWLKSDDGENIIAFVEVDPQNIVHVKQAIQLFGSIYLGFNVQQNAISDFDIHRIWTPGKLTGDGHCIDAPDYDSDKLTILTWGNTQGGTWDWWTETVDECYAIIPMQANDPNFAPGFDLASLKADLLAVQK